MLLLNQMKLPSQKGFTPILFVVLIAIASIGIIGGAYLLRNTSNKTMPNTPVIFQTSQASPSPQTSSSPIPDKHYCSGIVNFCVDMPANCTEEHIQVGQGGQVEELNAVEFKCQVAGHSSPVSFHITSSPYDNSFDLNTQEYCSADVCDKTDGGIFKSSRKIETINGITYYFHITPVSTNYSYIYFVQEGILYDLRYGSNDDPTFLNKFLKTFRTETAKSAAGSVRIQKSLTKLWNLLNG